MNLLVLIYNSELVLSAASILTFGNLVLRLGLAGVTLVSGVGKLVDPAAGRQAMSDFGVPPRWVDSAARALPIVEIVLGLAVLNDGTAPHAALALTCLFLIFSLGVGNLLRQDKAPPCNCFGAVHSEPVSVWTLLRVASFALLAFVCYHLPVFPAITGWWSLTFLIPSYLLVGKGVQKWALRRKTTLRRLSVGQRVPAVTLKDGRWLQSALPKQGKALLFFTSPACGACRDIKKKLSHVGPRVAEDLPFVEIVGLSDKQTFVPTEGMISCPLDQKALARFLSSTPGAILVDQSGTILEPPVIGAEQIEALLRVALQRQ
jgi:hypothetical protein